MAKSEQKRPEVASGDGRPPDGAILDDHVPVEVQKAVAIGGYLLVDKVDVPRLYGEPDWTGQYFEIATGDILGKPASGDPKLPAGATIVLVRGDATITICEPVDVSSLDENIDDGRWPRRLHLTQAMVDLAFSDQPAAPGAPQG